jgi:hypothetical protein
MKRKRRQWIAVELALLGKLPEAEVAQPTGRNLGTIWQKRRALGIDQPAPAECRMGGPGDQGPPVRSAASVSVY